MSIVTHCSKSNKAKKSWIFYFVDGWRTLNDVIPWPHSLLISGLEGKLAQGLCLSKVSWKNTFLWLEAWYGGHDHGNAIRNLLLQSLFFFALVTIVHEMAKSCQQGISCYFCNTKFDCMHAVNSLTFCIILNSSDVVSL